MKNLESRCWKDWVNIDVKTEWPIDNDCEEIIRCILGVASNYREASILIDELVKRIGQIEVSKGDGYHSHSCWWTEAVTSTEEAFALARDPERLYQVLCEKISPIFPNIETTTKVFSKHLENLKIREDFAEIYTSEKASYTVFWGHKENEPDRLDYHHKENPLKQRGVMFYKHGGSRSELHNYPKGRSSELYLLEDGSLLKCKVNNQMNETPMDPATRTTTKNYVLSRAKKAIYEIPVSYIKMLGASQSTELLLKII